MNDNNQKRNGNKKKIFIIILLVFLFTTTLIQPVYCKQLPIPIRVPKQFQSNDYYTVLGLSKRFSSRKRIKKAYRQLALKYHPDKIKNQNDNNERQSSEAIFIKISEAYDVLGDEKLKDVYDKYGKSGLTAYKKGMDPEEAGFSSGNSRPGGWSPPRQQQQQKRQSSTTSDLASDFLDQHHYMIKIIIIIAYCIYTKISRWYQKRKQQAHAQAQAHDAHIRKEQSYQKVNKINIEQRSEMEKARKNQQEYAMAQSKKAKQDKKKKELERLRRILD
jgi:curved DNA-binding protein CbpA